jgi:hypothetical protein
LNGKKFEKEYELKQTYLNFNKKFELPKISKIMPKILKRKPDVSPYNRAARLNSIHSMKSLETSQNESYINSSSNNIKRNTNVSRLQDDIVEK